MEAKWECTIRTDNEAFAERNDGELARILRKVADYVERGHVAGHCMDINGNKVGAFGYFVE